MSYHHFTSKERIFLYELLKKRKSFRDIAGILGRNVSSISREVNNPNHQKNGKYSPFVADVYASSLKHDKAASAIKVGTKEWFYVMERLEKFWSPETISGRWHKEYPRRKRLSTTTIYRYVRSGMFPGITPETHFRRRGKHLVSREDANKFNSVKPDRLVHEWSGEIRKRSVIGHWEGDTILGGVGKGLAISLVDRKSRYLKAALSPTKKSSVNCDFISEILKDEPVKSITFDNGVEFAEYHTIEQNLNTLVYFAEPHKPWQRGTNENTNGLLRFFFPKGCDFKAVTQDELDYVVDLLNNRPRKCLGWKTPAEVYKKSVALT